MSHNDSRTAKIVGLTLVAVVPPPVLVGSLWNLALGNPGVTSLLVFAPASARSASPTPWSTPTSAPTSAGSTATATALSRALVASVTKTAYRPLLSLPPEIAREFVGATTHVMEDHVIPPDTLVEKTWVTPGSLET